MSLLLLAKSGLGRAGAAPEPPVAPFFEDHFAGGQLNPSSEFVYSNPLGGVKDITIVAAGDSGAFVKEGFTHALRCTYPSAPLVPAERVDHS